MRTTTIFRLIISVMLFFLVVGCTERSPKASAGTSNSLSSADFLKNIESPSEKGKEIVRLDLSNRPIDNLDILTNLVEELNISGTRVSDLTPLAQHPLRKLWLRNTPVTNLSPLRLISLEILDLTGCQIESLTSLSNMPLRELSLADNQRLKDLSPLSGLKLEGLNLSRCGSITDLSPLKKLPLTHLNLGFCIGFSDLKPLKDMPLQELDLGGDAQITDLSVLKGRRIHQLNLSYTRVSDLSPIAKMPLQYLNLHGVTTVTDLNALRDMPLAFLWFTPWRATSGLDGIRNNRTLQRINGLSSVEFWEKYDEGERTIGMCLAPSSGAEAGALGSRGH